MTKNKKLILSAIIFFSLSLLLFITYELIKIVENLSYIPIDVFLEIFGRDLILEPLKLLVIIGCLLFSIFLFSFLKKGTKYYLLAVLSLLVINNVLEIILFHHILSPIITILVLLSIILTTCFNFKKKILNIISLSCIGLFIVWTIIDFIKDYGYVFYRHQTILLIYVMSAFLATIFLYLGLFFIIMSFLNLYYKETQQLLKLKDNVEKGILTEAEYEKAKKEILSKL